jgi:hypothetical protein
MRRETGQGSEGNGASLYMGNKGLRVARRPIDSWAGHARELSVASEFVKPKLSASGRTEVGASARD